MMDERGTETESSGYWGNYICLCKTKRSLKVVNSAKGQQFPDYVTAI